MRADLPIGIPVPSSGRRPGSPGHRSWQPTKENIIILILQLYSIKIKFQVRNCVILIRCFILRPSLKKYLLGIATWRFLYPCRREGGIFFFLIIYQKFHLSKIGKEQKSPNKFFFYFLLRKFYQQRYEVGGNSKQIIILFWPYFLRFSFYINSSQHMQLESVIFN